MAEETGTTNDGVETATVVDTDTTTAPASGPELGDAGKRALAEERKARRAAEKQLEDLRKAQMTEQEKAVAEAKAAGLAEAAKVAGPRLVRAEFRATAAGRVDKDTLDAYLEDVDLAKFVDDSGDVDAKAIEARVKRLSGGGRGADFDGGARGGAARPVDMSGLIRQKAGVI